MTEIIENKTSHWMKWNNWKKLTLIPTLFLCIFISAWIVNGSQPATSKSFIYFLLLILYFVFCAMHNCTRKQNRTFMHIDSNYIQYPINWWQTWNLYFFAFFFFFFLYLTFFLLISANKRRRKQKLISVDFLHFVRWFHSLLHGWWLLIFFSQRIQFHSRANLWFTAFSNGLEFLLYLSLKCTSDTKIIVFLIEMA